MCDKFENFGNSVPEIDEYFNKISSDREKYIENVADLFIENPTIVFTQLDNCSFNEYTDFL